MLRRVATAETIEIDDGAVAAVARSASGSFRDALGTLDQLVAYGGKRIETDDVLAVLGVADATLILAAADAIAEGNGRATLEASEGLARSGRDVAQFGRDLLAHLRQLLIIRAAGDDFGSDALQAADPARMQAQADSFTDLGLTRAIDSVSAALTAIREGDEPRMTMELALLRAARPQLDPGREAFAQRLERVERALEGKGSPRRPRRRSDPLDRRRRSRRPARGVRPQGLGCRRHVRGTALPSPKRRAPSRRPRRRSRSTSSAWSASGRR